MTYCIRNAAFFDFRWTYTMRTLHNSECSSSLRRSLISSHSNHMMTHTIFISGFDTFYCRFLASFMIGLLRFFHTYEVFFLWILAKPHSYAVALFLISLQHYYKKMHPFCYHYYLQTSGTSSRVYKLLNRGVPNLINGITHCNNGMADNDEGFVHWLSYLFSWVLDVAIKSLNAERHSWYICLFNIMLILNRDCQYQVPARIQWRYQRRC